MIYYFTGSGNSEAVALALGSLVGDSVQKAGAFSIAEADSLGFVFPVYSWGIAPFLLKWIGRVKLPDKKPLYVYAVLDYGDEAGYAHKILRKALLKRGLVLNAVFGVKMPNTYVLLPGFNVDPSVIAAAKVADSIAWLKKTAGRVKNREMNIEDVYVGPLPGLKSGVIFPLFKKWGIFPSRWHFDPDKCIGCGQCAHACPVGNVTMVDQQPIYSGNGNDCGLYLGGGHPQWGKNCTSCLGCYHACPEHAVRYGHDTIKKGQWRFWFTHGRHTLLSGDK